MLAQGRPCGLNASLSFRFLRKMFGNILWDMLDPLSGVLARGRKHRPGTPLAIREGNHMKRNLQCAAYCLAVVWPLFWYASASAAAYPEKPVRLIVGFPPGGAVDILARALVQKLDRQLRQNVVVDNRPGAGSSIGAEIAAKAQPDGYTLLMVSAAHVLSAVIREKLPYHPVDSFAPITQIASSVQVLLTSVATQKDLDKLLVEARARPRKLNYASAGYGTTTHLAGELLKSMAGVDITHVPYKGAVLALADVVSGQVELMFMPLPSALQLIKGGRVKAVAISSSRRHSSLPDIPTIAESVPGYEVLNWYAMLAPARTPGHIVTRLQQETVAALHTPELSAEFVRYGADPIGSSPQELKLYMEAELEKWTRIARRIDRRVSKD